MIILMAALAVLAGLLFAVQGPVNTAAGSRTNTMQGSVISFLGGTIALILIVLIFGAGNLTRVAETAPWQYLGGLFGLVSVAAVIFCIPVLGAGLSTMIIMLGQLIMSAVIDGFGLFGTDRIAPGFLRIGGIVLVCAGIFFVNFGGIGRKTGEGSDKKNGRRIGCILFSFAAGVLSVMQSPINASLAAVIGNWESTLVSFAVGLIAAVILMLVVNRGRISPMRHVGMKPWMFMGGLLGVGGIFLNLYVVYVLGSALQVACSMVGQIGGSILIDTFGILGAPRIRIDRFRVIGLILIAAGMVFVTAARF